MPSNRGVIADKSDHSAPLGLRQVSSQQQAPREGRGAEQLLGGLRQQGSGRAQARLPRSLRAFEGQGSRPPLTLSATLPPAPRGRQRTGTCPRPLVDHPRAVPGVVPEQTRLHILERVLTSYADPPGTCWFDQSLHIVHPAKAACLELVINATSHRGGPELRFDGSSATAPLLPCRVGVRAPRSPVWPPVLCHRRPGGAEAPGPRLEQRRTPPAAARAGRPK